MNNRFPILTFVSVMLKIIGWVAVGIGLVYTIVKGIIIPLNKGRGSYDLFDLLSFFQGIGLSISGLMIAAFGEIIGVFFAIEANTRKTYDAVSRIITMNNSHLSHYPEDTEKGPIYCTNCGAKVELGTFECVACGTKVGEPKQKGDPAAYCPGCRKYNAHTDVYSKMFCPNCKKYVEDL